METEGLTDLQVNGYAGVDFNTVALTADALDHALRAMLRDGVTCCLPTLITAPEDVLRARLAALDLAVAQSQLGPAMVPGFHLEGPFLNPGDGYAGCHPPDAMILPSPDRLDRIVAGLRRPIVLLTLAPEREGAMPTIVRARALGMVVAIGHTGPDAATIAKAVEAGATLSTHLGNAMPRLLHKLDNPMMAQLAEDRLTATFIADGIHVSPAALKTMLRAKGLDRSILVTDATAAAAAKPGIYEFAGMQIEHAQDGSVRVPGTTALAGSALRLDVAIRNLIAWGLASPLQAIGLASRAPNAAIRSALAAHDMRPPHSRVTWSDTIEPKRIIFGGKTISNPAK